MRAYRRMIIALGRFRWFSWLTYTIIVPLDRALYKHSGGRLSVAHIGARRPSALPTLLLTTTGRKSGEPRSTPVLYLEDGDRLVVVASNFGREHHPAWSGNLLADPRATVRIRDHERSVVARPATQDEKQALWPQLLELYPTWEAYTHRTDRSFRAFFLESPPPLGGDGRRVGVA